MLIAARTVDTFCLGRPTALQLAALADNALGWREPPSDRPCTLDALAEQLVALGEVRELIEVRDRALRHAGLPSIRRAGDEPSTHKLAGAFEEERRRLIKGA